MNHNDDSEDSEDSGSESSSRGALLQAGLDTLLWIELSWQDFPLPSDNLISSNKFFFIQSQYIRIDIFYWGFKKGIVSRK